MRTELQEAHRAAQQTWTHEDPVQLTQQITKARSETEDMRAVVAADSLAAGGSRGRRPLNAVVSPTRAMSNVGV